MRMCMCMFGFLMGVGHARVPSQSYVDIHLFFLFFLYVDILFFIKPRVYYKLTARERVSKETAISEFRENIRCAVINAIKDT